MKWKIVVIFLTNMAFVHAKVPSNFGPDGLYSCHCEQDQNCDSETGQCPGDKCASGYYNPSCQIKSVAYNKIAKDFPSHGGERPTTAVDGKLDTDMVNGARCTHTKKSESCAVPVAWWQVDLGEEMNISAIWMLNRASYSARRLKDVFSKVSAEDSDWQQRSKECFYVAKSFGGSNWYRGTCKTSMQGRYVRIEKQECDPIGSFVTLCEVVVVQNIYVGVSLTKLTAAELQGSILGSEELTDLYNRSIDATLQFHLKLYEGQSRNVALSNVHNSIVTSEIKNLSKTNKHFTLNVRPWKYYTIEVRPYHMINDTKQYLSGVDSVRFATPAAVPSKPRSIVVVDNTNSSVRLRWQDPLYPHGVLGKYLIVCTSPDRYWNATTFNTTAVLSPLPAGHRFLCSISASTEAGYGNATQIFVSTVPPTPAKPPIPEILRMSQTGFVVRLMSYDTGLVRPSYYLFLVEEIYSSAKIKRSISRALKETCTITDAQVFKNISALTIPAEGKLIIIENTSEGNRSATLKNGATYVLHVVAANVFGEDTSYSCSRSMQFLMSYEEPGRTDKQNLAVPLGSGVAGFFSLVIAVTLLVVLCRRRMSKQMQAQADFRDSIGLFSPQPLSEEGSAGRSTANLQSPNQKPSAARDPRTVLQESKRQPTSASLSSDNWHPTGIAQDVFLQHVQKMKQKHCSGFLREYKDILENEYATTMAGSQQFLKRKNRYKNILPYDHSRVLLADRESDYINASYIKGFKDAQHYIAAQAPMDNTVGDFVQMLWQEDVECVVMLNQVYENGKKRCAQYWPLSTTDSPITIDDYVISLKEVTQHRFYEVKLLTIDKQSINERRELFLHHYTSWPDFGVPQLCGGMLELRNEVRARRGDKPLLVYCSAGVGRTGTFLALDILLDCSTSMPVQDCVKLLRQQRMNMVQVPEQYVFLHEALLEAVTQDLQPMRNSNFVQWALKPSTTPLLQQHFQVLKVVATGNSEVEEQAEAETNLYANVSTSAAVELKFGLPASCTVKLLQFADDTAENITSACINHIVHSKPEQTILLSTSFKSLSFPFSEHSTTAKAISDAVYANVEAQKEQIKSVGGYVVSVKEQTLPTAEVLNTHIDICTPSAEDNAYANLSDQSQELWSGNVLHVASVASSESQVACVCELLRHVLEKQNILILYQRTSLPLLQLLLLSYATLKNLTHQQVDLYSAAKRLTLDLQKKRVYFTLTQEAYTGSCRVLQKHLSSESPQSANLLLQL